MSGERIEYVRKTMSLSDIAVWVLGSAVFFALARGASGFWGNPIPTLNADRTIGLILMAVSVWVAIRITRDLIWGRAGSQRFGRILRLLALLVLGILAVVVALRLREEDRSTGFSVAFLEGTWRANLATLGLSIGLIGVLLAIVPISPQPRRRPRSRISVAGSIILAAVTGLITICLYSIAVPYLVLIALEAVHNALTSPGVIASQIMTGKPIDPLLVGKEYWRSLHDRLNTAGLQSLFGLLACMVTAFWVESDLRRNGSQSRVQPGIRLSYRILTTVVTWSLGFFLLFVGLPKLDPWLAEGFWQLLKPWGAGMMTLSFLTLAGGLAARGLTLRDLPYAVDELPDVRRVWTVRFAVIAFRLAVTILLIMLILAAIVQIRGDETMPWYVPISLKAFLATSDELLTIQTSTAIYFDPGKAPEVFILLGMVVGILGLGWRLLRKPRAADQIPIDQISRDPRRIGEFIGSWLAISGVVFTLFPTFILGGLALMHYLVRATAR